MNLFFAVHIPQLNLPIISTRKKSAQWQQFCLSCKYFVFQRTGIPCHVRPPFSLSHCCFRLQQDETTLRGLYGVRLLMDKHIENALESPTLRPMAIIMKDSLRRHSRLGHVDEHAAAAAFLLDPKERPANVTTDAQNHGCYGHWACAQGQAGGGGFGPQLDRQVGSLVEDPPPSMTQMQVDEKKCGVTITSMLLHTSLTKLFLSSCIAVLVTLQDGSPGEWRRQLPTSECSCKGS